MRSQKPSPLWGGRVPPEGAGEGAAVRRSLFPALDTGRTPYAHPHPSFASQMPPFPWKGEGLRNQGSRGGSDGPPLPYNT